MFNPFVLKKWFAILICATLPVIAYMISLPMFTTSYPKIGWLYAILTVLATAIISGFIGTLFLKNPFTDVLEGKGLLCLDLNSTGIITPFIINVKQGGLVKGKLGNQIITDIFDRESVYQLAEPVMVERKLEQNKENGEITLTIKNEEYHRAKFALYHYPTLIYNSQIGTLLTKEYLSNQEKKSFIEHTILYLNKQIEGLNNALLNFGRYVVELTKPQESWLQNKWVWIIVIVFIGILAFAFAPTIIETFKGTASSLSGTGSTIIPK